MTVFPALSPFVIKHREALFDAAMTAHGRGDPRHSHFRVGAAVLTVDGEIFGGANWETDVLDALGKANHAEQSALASMIASIGPKRIVAVAVMGGDPAHPIPCTPCGNCREHLSIHAEPDTPVFLIGVGGKDQGVHQLDDLLPCRSGSYDPARHGPTIAMPPNIMPIFEELAHLQKHGYAPYSKAPVAAAIKTETGELFYGVTREDAAYSGFSALQNALGAMLTALGPSAKVASVYYGAHPTDPDGIVQPSGPDRQGLREHCRNPDSVTVYAKVGDGVVQHTLSTLLPHSFGPENLGISVEPGNNPTRRPSP